jgi:hypothetical protein
MQVVVYRPGCGEQVGIEQSYKGLKIDMFPCLPRDDALLAREPGAFLSFSAVRFVSASKQQMPPVPLG